MLKFLKSLISPGGGTHVTLAESEVMSWLVEQEENARATLHVEVEEPMRTIRNAASVAARDGDQSPARNN